MKLQKKSFCAFFLLFHFPVSGQIEHSQETIYKASFLIQSIKKHPKVTLMVAAVTATAAILYKKNQHYWQRIYWNWATINPCNAHFPKNFLFGVGCSAHQFESDCNNNTWSKRSPWAQQMEREWKNKGINFEFSGNACNLDKTYITDIRKLKKLGFKLFRFGIEWSKIEPEEGVIDLSQVERYINMIRECINNNIRPVITLHHYTDPIWFMQKGGFEKQENTQYFARYGELLFSYAYHKLLKKLPHEKKGLWPLWLTFNSPSGYAAKSYLIGIAPPLKKDIHIYAQVLKNMMAAHIEVYQNGKKVCKELTIGILKNIHQLDPARWWHPLDRFTCYFGTQLMDDCIFNFFTTGIFKIHIPGKAYVRYENQHAPKSLDVIGLNYYSHRFSKNMSTHISPHEVLTENPNYTVYPEGLYRAVHQINKRLAKPLNIPIYVTENGIGTNDNSLRTEFMQKYLYALSEAIKDGIDVRGYCCWALCDNYEWGTYEKCYGVLTKDRKVKKGSQYYLELVKTHR